MSKLLRLPLLLLAVLALFLLSPGLAAADAPTTPTADECAEDPDLEGCETPPVADGLDDVGLQESADEGAPPPDDTGTLEQPDQLSSGGPAAPLEDTSVRAFDPVTGQALLCDADDTTLPPPCPESPGEPGTALTCDELADLLGIPGGCPESFTCEDLADLLGVTCPEGPPDCEVIADLFGLEGCPEPPTSCNEFADLLGVDNCSEIPCIDISQLPEEAKAGLAPLLDGLEQIGIKACPEAPTVSGGNDEPPVTGGQGTGPGVYYANCDDARAQGKAPVYAGQPGYRPELDSDSDGIGCEVETQQAVASNQPIGRLAYTGVDVEGLIRLGAILISGGTLILLAGVRRA